MSKNNHISASADHYDKQADTYDLFNEANSQQINQTIEKILKHHTTRTVLDFTCGTGSQVFYLHQRNFDVTGCDISPNMLEIAHKKASTLSSPPQLILGDIRTSNIGTFDAVITIFNSIGHLTKDDFEISLQNIYQQLNPKGLYIFDIFNLDYFLYQDNITKLTIDWLKQKKETTFREIQYSTITADGILTSYDIYHQQINHQEPIIQHDYQTLQIYSQEQIIDLLHKQNFKIIKQTNIDGTPFSKHRSERIITTAQKI